MPEATSAAQKAFRNSVIATLAAVVLVAGINLFFMIRYQPRYTAYSVVSVWTYRIKHRQANSRSVEERMKDDDEVKKAREVIAQRLSSVESLLKSSDAQQVAEDACRAAGLEVIEYEPSQFNDRVSVQQAGMTYAIGFSCEKADVAAAAANGLADWCAAKRNAQIYENSLPYYSASLSRIELAKAVVTTQTEELKKLTEMMTAADPKSLDKEVLPADFNRMKELAGSIGVQHLDEAIIALKVKTLQQLKEDESQLFDPDALATLQKKQKDIGQEMANNHREIRDLWKRIAKGDTFFPKVESARLKRSNATRVLEKLSLDVGAMEEDFLFQVTEPAETPESPSVGRPALAMILFSGLAILVPYLLAFFFSRGPDDAPAR